MKKIKVKNIKKRVIILSKSGGIEDINTAYANIINSKNEIAFYELPRNLIKEIFLYFLKNYEFGDYYTLDYNENVKDQKEKYKKFIFKIFKYLDSYWKFDALISFNIFYYAENDLPEPIQKLGKKFIVLHKESVNSVEETKINLEIYTKKNKKFFGSKVAVYCENEKKTLIDSNILNEKQVEVIGCARSDYSFSLRKQKPIQNEIVYFMIENNRSATEKMLTGELVDWSNLINTTNNYLIELAENNPSLKIIFKGKKNVHSRDDLPQNLPNNCLFSNSNPGHKFLKNANVVISFNSTILFEAILANRNVIIPIFDVDKKKLEKIIYKSPDLFSSDKKNFFEKINSYIQRDYTIKEMNKDEKECVEFYLGNSDGRSGQKLKNFIDRNL